MNNLRVQSNVGNSNLLNDGQATLQRKCSCGKKTIAKNKCSNCTKKNNNIHRTIVTEAGLNPIFNTIEPELSTQEIQDAGVPLPAGVPSSETNDSPLVEQEEPAHSCVPTGQFTSIPSGTIPATATASKFGASFNMNAEFQAPIPCNCSCGEYRQYVRGFGSINGTDVNHALCGNTLSRTTWHEDCKTVGGTDLKYGYHSIPFATSRFTNPDQATGCNFNGFDAPGFPLAGRSSGDKLELHLEFTGYLVDACDNDRRLRSSSWTVAGKHTVT